MGSFTDAFGQNSYFSSGSWYYERGITMKLCISLVRVSYDHHFSPEWH